ANIAFIHEWTLLAEKSGVNLWDVVDAIRIRKGTHDSMRYPGFGVGGYCLTKDSLLAQWGGENLLQVDTGLDTTLRALQTNYHMPLHTLDLLRELLGENLKGKSVVLCGISYLPDVGDTRNSPSQIFADAALTAGVKLTLHDPNVSLWPERPDVPFVHNLEAAIATADALVFTLPHSDYHKLTTETIAGCANIVDANNVFDDTRAADLHHRGVRIIGTGKGHWRTTGLHKKS
ncbi:MAG: UDP binding domain-containing protein, partial [Chthoniobacterales bacterium]